ncbi:hypothetical protein NON00_09775 [Roseomonas sp. GC11]|uniref:hypothetical protein n=1 Tax=Roseomonas sp. GC11 TaxID=2950546 RepID=UPI002109E99F|nr:hypothetical protein [Roseomonas sp. GC11]MCQ4160216.1 hypothetical protein [Roseomonas sp. GC11]
MRLSSLAAITAAIFLSACQQQDPDWANKAALRIGAPLENAAALRETQTARFADVPEQRLLIEATQVLQDLGFTIEESAPRYGVLAGSKDRDATEAGQVAGQVALAIGLALVGVRYDPIYDTDQVIRATLTTRPLGARDSQLRVSFERIVTTNKGFTRVERLSEPEFSTGFFEKVRAGLARGA